MGSFSNYWEAVYLSLSSRESWAVEVLLRPLAEVEDDAGGVVFATVFHSGVDEVL